MRFEEHCKGLGVFFSPVGYERAAVLVLALCDASSTRDKKRIFFPGGDMIEGP